MALGDGGLQRVIAAAAAQPVRPGQGRAAASNLCAVPAGTVLVGEQHGGAVRPGAGAEPRGLKFHQGDQRVCLGFPRHQRNQHPADPQGFAGQIRPDPAFP